MEIVNYSYEDIEKLCVVISKKIEKSNFKTDYILGVAVSGLIPAVIFARILNIKKIMSVSVSSYEKKKQKELKLLIAPDKSLLKGKNVLIVDDICDTGNTIIFLKDLFKTYNVKSIKCATLFLNKEHSKITPDFYGKIVNHWVGFPWDKFEKE